MDKFNGLPTKINQYGMYGIKIFKEVYMVDEKMLEEHHKICNKCWSGQEKVIGKRCSACLNHSEYEPIKDAKNMIRK